MTGVVGDEGEGAFDMVFDFAGSWLFLNCGEEEGEGRGGEANVQMCEYPKASFNVIECTVVSVSSPILRTTIGLVFSNFAPYRRPPCAVCMPPCSFFLFTRLAHM